MSSPRVVMVGPHQVELESELAVLRWNGQPSLDELREAARHMDEHRVGRPYFFTIADMRSSSPPDAQARRWMAEWMRTHPMTGYLGFGASRTLRGVLALMSNAIRLLGFRMPLMRFFETEGEARAWVKQEIARLSAR